MKYFDASNSLFLLTEEQQLQFSKLEYYDYFFHLIRPDFHQLSFARLSVSDFWVYYYFDEVPIVNSEHALIFLLRNFMLNEVIKQTNFKRLKKVTVGSNTNALMAAVLTVNLFLDNLHNVLQALPKEHYEFYIKFENNSKLLFNNRFSSYEHYPKKLVKIETAILKSLEEYITKNTDNFNNGKIKVIRFIDQFTLIEKELFKPVLSY